jgi:hypothetical protein
MNTAITKLLVLAALPVGAQQIWHPPANVKIPWQWQLTTPVNQSVNVSMYDIDMFDNAASVVASLHAAGRKVVCYIDFGTWENWRPDAGEFPQSVLGSQNGWPGERWLDIRQLTVLQPIMTKRIQLCKQKGFDAVEPDNIDGWENDTGFPITGQQQITYDTWIAKTVHAAGLSVGLKNNVDQASQLVGYFDWALDEQCYQYQECSSLKPFTNLNKAVFEVEYQGSLSSFCPTMDSLHFNSMEKQMALGAWREACP